MRERALLHQAIISAAISTHTKSCFDSILARQIISNVTQRVKVIEPLGMWVLLYLSHIVNTVAHRCTTDTPSLVPLISSVLLL